MKKQLIIFSILGLILSLLYYTSGIFFPSIEVIFLPVIIPLFIIGIIGIIIIPFSAYKLIQNKRIKKWQTLTVAISIGFYLSFIIKVPIDNWDEKQRNLSGQILSSEIEKYKNENGSYPEKLSELNLARINKLLPSNYKKVRFNYFVRGEEYQLYIPIPILDKWVWNKNISQFEYVEI